MSADAGPEKSGGGELCGVTMLWGTLRAFASTSGALFSFCFVLLPGKSVRLLGKTVPASTGAPFCACRITE
jgi:hypothetical protein